ncbi:MAG: hypothetical protein LH702_21085 [Phormidesmis sp. CAN_BIN44]|nr:hypothetical protein [Phormidesmis sp. CAN_BIN44]
MAAINLKRLPYGTQWMASIGIGILTWFVAISFVRALPPPLQLLSMLVPIASFGYGLYVLPKWQEEGKQQDLIKSLVERERAHRLMRQHHLNLASGDVEFDGAMRALKEMYPEEIEVTQEAERGTTPHAQLAPPDQSTYLLKVQQEVMQACGDIGWSAIEYVSGRGAQNCDKDGWISVEKLRDNWAKVYGLKADDLRSLLSSLTNIQVGEWKDSNLKEWRLLLTL